MVAGSWDRYMGPGGVAAPGRGPRGSGVEKLRTVPGAALQRPQASGAGAGAGAGACAMRAPAASPIEGPACLLYTSPNPRD